MMFLNCHTWYSLRYGTFSEKELCELALKNSAEAIALTDINSTSGCLSFLRIAEAYSFKPLVGVDIRNGVDQQYVVLAKNNEGFRQLNAFVSEYIHRKEVFPAVAPDFLDCAVIYPFEKVLEQQKTEFKPNEFIGVSTESIRKLKFSAYRDFSTQLIFMQSVSFRNKKDYNAHRLLRAIAENTLLSKLSVSEQGNLEEQMHTAEEIEQTFQEFPHIIKQTEKLIESCDVSFSFGKNRENRNLQIVGKNRKADEQQLRKLCRERRSSRYPKLTVEIEERITKELKAIISLGFVSYFLINLEIVEYARSQNFPYVGRGSGANSVVAYILGITNVDPIELDLYFERFINASRKSPPDFDIDFSWKDRDAVTRHIFETYEHTALMGTYVTFKRRAVMRELGKVFGLPKAQIDVLSSGYYRYENLDELDQLVMRYSKYIEGFPNYLSVHSGGIVILNDEVHCYTGTFMPPKGFATLQIDMHISEEVGIHKFDILSQRGLSKITDALALIQQNQPQAIIKDIDNIAVFKNDPKINNLLKTGDCMGVFYVESPAMRGLLTKLQTDNYLNLVAASSIIRPGISSGGMKEEYIKRHRDPERRKQAHPVMFEIMPDTYGIMVYQEDVMKVAHHFAGLNFDDADVLRRGMSGKKTSKGQMHKIETKFRENCRLKNYTEALITEVWEQISSFAGYAFPKGHSASYAVESYQSLYLKCYFPLEFMVAVLNNGGGFYNVETYLQEIRKCGGTIHAPCINKSDHPNSICGKDIYLGFGYVKELEQKTIQQILENRQFFGDFLDFDDFIDRVTISIEQLSILIRIDAFRFTKQDKHHLLWKAYFKLGNQQKKLPQETLFKTEQRDFSLPKLSYSFLVHAYDQIELLGFPLCSHFEMLKNEMKSSLSAVQLSAYIGKNVSIYGNLITVKKTSTVKGDYMYFGTFFDRDGNVFDTVQFPKMAQKYPIRTKGVFLCRGKVTDSFGYLSIIINSLERQQTQVDPRLVESQGVPIK